MLERIGKYEIRLQIGRGAMGVVYEGFDPVIGRRVAIKTLRTEMFAPRQLPDVLVRFKREAQSAGRLSHPHIVTIHEFGEEQGTPYIVMEYMSGNELGHLLERGSRFSLDEVVRIMTQLLGALTHAHEHGVVHRDLKPANMFLLDDGSLKVVDFGIARVESSDLTDTGAMLGTPAYMPPEQCLGLQVDHRSDLFSAGVILYQLLTGDKPFTGSVTTIIQKVLRQEPIAPSELNPTLSPAWDKVVARAMAKKPEARFESAKHFAEAIKAAHSAERAHEDEGRRKAAEAEEHVQRGAEERSRSESLRRAEDERRDAEEEAKKAAEEKTKALVLKKEEEEKKKTEAVAKKEADAKALGQAETRRKAEEQAKADAEARRKAEEQAKVEAAKKAEEARRATPRAGSAFRDCEGCPEMVMIAAGNFLMGSPSSEEGRDSDEDPQHQVSIPRSFAAGKYEVTFDEWDTCVRESGCSHNPGDAGWGRGRRPAINVSWQDAKQYAEWLSRKTGKRYRLLTEAEWEYVARAGTTTAFSTGATIAASQANYGQSRKQTAPVGSYGANAFGLFDVHGNVWEWTEDCWNSNYNGAPVGARRFFERRS